MKLKKLNSISKKQNNMDILGSYQQNKFLLLRLPKGMIIDMNTMTLIMSITAAKVAFAVSLNQENIKL